MNKKFTFVSWKWGQFFFKEGKYNFFDLTWTEITEIIFSTSCKKFKIFPFIIFEKRQLAQGIRRPKAAESPLYLNSKVTNIKITILVVIIVLFNFFRIYTNTQNIDSDDVETFIFPILKRHVKQDSVRLLPHLFHGVFSLKKYVARFRLSHKESFLRTTLKKVDGTNLWKYPLNNDHNSLCYQLWCA